MTVTLDSKSLNVTKFTEDCQVIYSQRDKWETEDFVRKIEPQGSIREWWMDCYEDGVSWTNSAAKNFQTKADAGSAVAFSVSESDMHSVSCNVYILRCTIEYPKGVDKTEKFRRFKLYLIEAQ